MLPIYNDSVNINKPIEMWETSDFVKYVESCQISQRRYKKESESDLKCNDSDAEISNRDTKALDYSRDYLVQSFINRGNMNGLFLSLFGQFGINFDHQNRSFSCLHSRKCTQWDKYTRYGETDNYQRTYLLEYAISH